MFELPENSYTAPTAYAGVNSVLNILLSNAQAILGSQVVGLYLYGSLASGDFDPGSSDIDFVVVTDGELSLAVVSALEKMHAILAASGEKWAAKLEGSYISQKALRRYHPEDGPFPCINEGAFYLACHQSDWIIQRHILRTQGVVVAGPDPAVLIEPVTPQELRQAVLGFLQEWWRPMLSHPARLQSAPYQAYAVLTMCRVLYTLASGEIASKPASAEWALCSLDSRWAGLIRWALKQPINPQVDQFRDTLELIRYTLEYAGN